MRELIRHVGTTMSACRARSSRTAGVRSWLPAEGRQQPKYLTWFVGWDWRAFSRSVAIALEPVAPALILLWLPRLMGSLGGLPGADQPGHTALSIPALLAGGLAPLWIAAGWARLRGRSLSGMVRILRERGWLGPRLVRFLVLAPTLTAFFANFAVWKSAIPLLDHGFPWDTRLELLEIWLHGDHPDRLLAPVLGAPQAILFLDRMYETWFYLLFTLVLWQAWEADRRYLRQFWTAFALVWIVLGIFVASGFASAGPMYAGLDRGSSSYDDLLARLDAAGALAPLFVHLSSWSLWEAFRQPEVSIGDGISAFPSLHVAIVVLAALAAWRFNRWAGTLTICYALMIFLGSIMLGWHYALDGEAAALATIAIWILAGRWATRAYPTGHEPGYKRNPAQ